MKKVITLFFIVVLSALFFIPAFAADIVKKASACKLGMLSTLKLLSSEVQVTIYNISVSPPSSLSK